MIRRAIELFKRHDLTVVFVVTLLIGIFLYFYRGTRDFGVNFITEMASVWITVFLVNRIMEKREKRRRVSIDQRILRETLSIIASYYSIWKHLVWRYFPDVKINSEEDLMKLYPDLVKNTKLSDRFEIVSIHDPESWKLFFHDRSVKECFENYYETLQNNIQQLMDDFRIYLEPELLGHLLELKESAYFSEVRSVLESDTSYVVNEWGMDTNLLSSYMSTSASHISKVIELDHYSKTLGSGIKEFVKFVPDYYDIGQYFSNPLTLLQSFQTGEIVR